MLVAMPANVEGRRGPYMPCAPANADSFWAGSLVTALPAMQLSARSAGASSARRRVAANDAASMAYG